ncbi:unnamed protein product, partial [Protopolystoma xenopodis]
MTPIASVNSIAGPAPNIAPINTVSAARNLVIVNPNSHISSSNLGGNNLINISTASSNTTFGNTNNAVSLGSTSSAINTSSSSSRRVDMHSNPGFEPDFAELGFRQTLSHHSASSVLIRHDSATRGGSVNDILGSVGSGFVLCPQDVISETTFPSGIQNISFPPCISSSCIDEGWAIHPFLYQHLSHTPGQSSSNNLLMPVYASGGLNPVSRYPLYSEYNTEASTSSFACNLSHRAYSGVPLPSPAFSSKLAPVPLEPPFQATTDTSLKSLSACD